MTAVIQPLQFFLVFSLVYMTLSTLGILVINCSIL